MPPAPLSKHLIAYRPRVRDNGGMKISKIPRPNEQRKVVELLVKLAKMKNPKSDKPAPIAGGQTTLDTDLVPQKS